MLYKISGIIYKILFCIINSKMACHKRIKTRSPNGLDIAHLSISPQFGQNPFSGYLGIIIFIVCAFLVKADGNHLVMPNCKKSKWLNAKIIVTKSWYNSIERFSSFILFYF